MEFLSSSNFYFTWIILPLLILFSRIIDQTFGTLRLIFASKGFKHITPILAFFESFIWLMAISQIMKHLDNIFCYIAYASGFAIGNYVGILLEEKISIGNVVIRIIPKLDSTPLIEYLKSINYKITIVNVEGNDGPTKMMYITIRRKNTQEIVNIIKKHNPYAFYTIEEVKYVSDLYIERKSKSIFSIFNNFNKNAK